MLKIGKSILGAAMLASLAATVTMPAQPAAAAPVIRPHGGHWVHGWHGGRFGWWWSGPDFWYWYPAPVYYDYYGPLPPDYVFPAGPAPQPTWYYCESAKGYYPYIRSCASGWRAVPADPQGQAANAQLPAPPPQAPTGTSKS